jgi:hypothetical protein
MISAAALLALAVIAFWIVGGIALRVVGLLLFFTVLLEVAFAPVGDKLALAVVGLPLGAILWLAGHWHFAVRHHSFKSPLAQRIFKQVLPRRLDPTRNWGVSIVERRARP